MSSVYLNTYINNAEFYLEKFIPKLAKGLLDWPGIQRMSTCFRQRGVCSLLLFGVADDLVVNLMQSGGAFLYFVQRCADSEKVTSQAKPFYDAIGGGFYGCAAEIVLNSGMNWAQGYEYEDDFLFIQFLMKHFFLGAPITECQTILEEFYKAQAGSEPERLAICEAFLNGDNQQFEETLPLLLERRSQKVEAMVKRGALPEEISSWLRYFSSEGMALVRLAKMKGFATDQTYLHIPDIVHRDPPFSFDPDAWRNLNYSP